MLPVLLKGRLRGDDKNDNIKDDSGLNPKPKGREAEEKKFIEGSIESVAMVDETTFVSGGDSGSICLWNTAKKKPIFTQALAHDFNKALSKSEGVIKTPRWITSLASLRYSDLFASGSWEGDVSLWKLDSKLKSFDLVAKIPAPGVVNSLQLITPPRGFLENASWALTSRPSEDATEPSMPKKNVSVNPFLLVIGVGHEHRLGRWLSVKEGGASNGTIVVAFSPRMLP